MSEEVGTSEVIMPAKSEDKLEIEKEELERISGSKDKLEKDESETEKKDNKEEGGEEEEKDDKKKFKLGNIPIKTPKVPGFLRSLSKERQSKKDITKPSDEETEDKTDDAEEEDDEGKSKDRVKELFEKVPRVSKLSEFLKKGKKENDGKEEEKGDDPNKDDNEEKKDEDKKNIFDNIKSKASQVPGLLKKKKTADTETGDKDESEELLENKRDEEQREEKGKNVLDSIRSMASQVFKKSKDGANDEDVEAAETESLLDQKKSDEVDSNKKSELEEIVIKKKVDKDNDDGDGDDKDEKVKEMKEETCSQGSEKKDSEKSPPSPRFTKEYTQRFQELEPQRKLALIAIIIGVILLILVIAIAAASSPSGWTNEIRFINDGKRVETHTSCGTVIGLVEAPDRLRFTGIPYAAVVSQTVQNRRFAHSRPALSLDECHSTRLTAYEDNQDTTCDNGETDCLTLNVYTTSVVYNKLMPVVVYVRGEDVPSSVRPSTMLAKNQSIVFVEVNFRSNAMGFLSHDSLSKAAYPHTSGNYGIGDIITALKWVHLNIQHFGGHPARITVFGAGVGGTIVTAMTTSPKAQGLYQRVWVSNGAGSFDNKTLERVSEDNEKIIKKLNCGSDIYICLMEADAETLKEAVPYEWQETTQSELPQNGDKEHSWIVVDKYILTHNPIDYWKNHNTETPFVFGATAQAEVTEDNYNFMDWTDKDTFEAHVEGKLGSFNVSLPRQAMDHYNSEDNWINYATMLSDIRTVCPILNLAEIQSANSGSKTYSYVATQPRSNVLGGIADSTSDISAILGVYDPQTPDEELFVSNMQELFYGFVNGGGTIVSNDVSIGTHLIGSDIVTTQKQYSNCEFWKNANHMVPEYANLD